MSRYVGIALVVGVMALSMLGVGCESTPVRAYRGAQHYAAGTEALTRNEAPLAIAELERAADLVPHASEIQNHLGLAYWSDGRTEAAKAAFERAIELDCDNLVAQSNFTSLMRSENFDAEPRIEGDARVDPNGR